LQDRFVWHVRVASSPNAYHVGDQPSILAIGLQLADGRLAEGMRLERVEDVHSVAGPHQLVMH
jgi:hypothetical protein